MACLHTYFPLAEYQDRWARAHRKMIGRGYEAAVVWGRTGSTYDRAGDVLFLTNYSSTKVGQPYDVSGHRARNYSAVVLRPGEVPELHVDDPGIDRDHIATDNVQVHSDPVSGVASSLRSRPPPGRVAFVGSDFFGVKYWQKFISETVPIDLEMADDLILDVRRRKSPRELDCCREGGRIAALALCALMDGLVARRREADSAAAAAKAIVENGGVVDRIACTFGDKIAYSCRIPLSGYSSDSPQRGDMVKGWLIGPMFQGYYLDPGRTAVAGGRPTAQQQALIESCAGIVEKIAHSIRAGVRYKDAADLGDKLVSEFGGDPDPGAAKHPFYGHPNGLYFEGPPYISNVVDHMDARFEDGNVIGVEAFLNLEGIGVAGFEQNYIVHDKGLELITPAPLFWH